MQARVGENILIVGTAHVSSESVAEVKAAIADFSPDVVAVELDEGRHLAITKKKEWESTPVTQLLKGNKLYLFLAQILLASYQRRIGAAEGVEPGAEMVAALRAGQEAGAAVALVDRDIGVTLKRAFGMMGLREKMRMFWELFKALFGAEEEDEKVDVRKMMDEDVIHVMMKELGEVAPSIKAVVIDERDTYLATRIAREAAGGRKVVAVVGAGHMRGIVDHLEAGRQADLAALETIPRKRFSVLKLVGYAVPLAILGVFGYLAWQGYQSGNYQDFLDAWWAWFLVNGILSALGAALARGHILSILTAFVAAPFTSLNPALAAGWFAGAMEAYVRKPQVSDFNALSQIETFGDFFRNRVLRVLMVAAFANLGSMAGTYIGAAKVIEILRS